MSADQYLRGVRAVILEPGLGKGRTRILCKQLERRGGSVEPSVCASTSHLLVGGNVRRSRLPVLLGGAEVPAGVRVVRADWLSACLTRGERLREEDFEVPQETLSKTPPTSAGSSPSKAGTGAEGVKDSPVKCAAKEEAGEGRVGEVAVGGAGEGGVGGAVEGGAGEGVESCDEDQQPAIERFPTSSRRWLPTHTSPNKRTAPDSDSDYVDSGEEGEGEGERQLADVDISAVAPLAKRKRRWICEIPKSEAQGWVNHNKHITDKLEELLSVYQNSAGDKWRAMSTTKVIQAIKKYPKEITTYEEARSLPFVGERLAGKIEEIISSGGLRRLDAEDKEKQAVLSAFTKIHGVGQTTAQQFYAQGYRSVEALAASGVLNRQQRIGVKHYDDFQERMPREEVAQIEEMVRELAHQINSGLEVVTCGSYRRGKPTCGDVDIMVSHCDGRSHRGVLPRLVERGRETGFVTDDLSIHNDQNGGGKYLGVCRLPGEDSKYRRIDLYATPYSEFPLMLLHFTGSGHFNRSMRSKADRLGMSLSEHSLNTGVIRKNGVKIFDGTPIPVFSEKDVFQYLDIAYREPPERDWD